MVSVQIERKSYEMPPREEFTVTIVQAARGSKAPADHFPPVQGVRDGLEKAGRHRDVAYRPPLIVDRQDALHGCLGHGGNRRRTKPQASRLSRRLSSLRP
jgi:hypothetical protein